MYDTSAVACPAGTYIAPAWAIEAMANAPRISPVPALLAYWKAVNGDPVSKGALMGSKSRLWRLARDMAGAMERDAEKGSPVSAPHPA